MVFHEGSDDFFNARSMDVFITKLRKKLQDDQEIQILNVRGMGLNWFVEFRHCEGYT